MTKILQSYHVYGMTIENYWEKFSAVSFWRVRKERRIIRAGLMNKPTRRQLEAYIN